MTVLSYRFLVRTSSLTFSSSMKKLIICGMEAHRHGLVKSSSEFYFVFEDINVSGPFISVSLYNLEMCINYTE